MEDVHYVCFDFYLIDINLVELYHILFWIKNFANIPFAWYNLNRELAGACTCVRERES